MTIDSLTICGLDELHGHAGAGFTHVLSILDPDWPRPSAFDAYPVHRRLQLRFHDVIDDPDPEGQEPPALAHVQRLLDFGRTFEAARLLVHCHAGISRSTAASILLLAQAEPARGADDIVAQIVEIRPKAWPNLLMIEMGDTLLDRKGALVAATRRRHRTVAAARPDIAEMMRTYGRARELDQ